MPFPGSCVQWVFTSIENVQTSYDNVAREYADKLYGELAGKPLTGTPRSSLHGASRMAECATSAAACTNPHATCATRGVDAFGVDLSRECWLRRVV
jgi:hypothetical protein